MNNLEILTLLMKALGVKDATSQTALQAWVDAYMPKLTEKAKGLLSGGFDVAAVMSLAVETVQAVQELKGIIAGKDRAQVAQIVLVVAARAALPDMVEAWVIPLLSGEGVKALIEAALLKAFGPEKVAASNVTDPQSLARNDDAYGKVATPDSFGPSMGSK